MLLPWRRLVLLLGSLALAGGCFVDDDDTDESGGGDALSFPWETAEDSGDTVEGGDSAFDENDVEPPVIKFQAVAESQPAGADLTIAATITDVGTGVFLATLFHRREADVGWTSGGFTRPSEGDDWTATIRGEDCEAGGAWYYLYAIDGSQNETMLPTIGPDAPYHVVFVE